MGFSGKAKASNVDFGALLKIEDKVMDEKKITEGENPGNKLRESLNFNGWQRRVSLQMRHKEE